MIPEYDKENDKAICLGCGCSDFTTEHLVLKNGQDRLLRICTQCGVTNGHAPHKTSNEEALKFVMPFGRYKDKLLVDIINDDKSYVDWLLKQNIKIVNKMYNIIIKISEEELI